MNADREYVRVWARYPPSGASSRYRIHQLAPYMNRHGYYWDIQALGPPLGYGFRAHHQLGPVARRVFGRSVGPKPYRLSIVQKEWLPPTLPLSTTLAAWRFRKGVPLAWDIDDAVWRYKGRRQSVAVWHLERSDAVVVATSIQADDAIWMGAREVAVVPTTIDPPPKRCDVGRNERSEAFDIVWVGSPSTAFQLEAIAEPIRDFLAIFAEARLHVLGAHVVHGLTRHPQVLMGTWSQENELDLMEKADVALAPSAGSPHEEGRGGFKITKYLAYGIASIASDTPLHREVGSNCVWYVQSLKEWQSALSELYLSERARKDLAARARTRHRQHLTPVRAAAEWARILDSMGLH